MLKNNSSVSACSLSSCRLKAEALARALNSRIWPCTWVGGEPSGDGMSAPDEEDDLYFDASPSPIDDEDSIARYPRKDDSSAATVAGRAKLYELLQQHVADDATDVFYDVSEDSTLTDQKHAVEMCRADEHTQGSNCQKCQSDDIDVHFSNVNNHDPGNDLVSSEQLCHLKDHCVDTSPGDSATADNLLNGKSMSEIPQVSSEHLCHSANHRMGESHVDNATEGDILDGKLMSDTSERSTNFNFNEQLETCKLDSGSFNDVDLCTLNTNKGEIKQSDQNQFSDCDQGDHFSNELLSSINNGISALTFETFKDTETSENIENASPSSDKAECNDRTEKRTSFRKTPFPKDMKCKCLEDTITVEVAEDEIGVLECSEGSESTEEKVECDKSSPKLKAMVSIEISEDSPTSSLTELESKDDSPKSSLHVFNEDRPMISRSTSLKTGKTPPGTPSRKKIVRFADVLGLDLEDVRHIMPSDLPNIPSSAYTDLVLSDDDKPTPTNEVVVLQSTQSDSVFKSAAGFNSLYPMFSVPGLMSDFKERVRAQGICLESVTVSDLSIQCTCRVMNWGYKKRVIARYTVNDWASSNDIDASYVAGSTQDDADAFSFNIFLSSFHKNVKFALRYQVNGKEYWDNNRGDNYCLGNYSDVRSSPSTSPTWAHQFW